MAVSLELQPAEFVLLVVDNGRGFQWNHGTATPVTTADGLRCAAGNGLLNMQKRMEEIHGRCDWETAPGKGTRLKLAAVVKDWAPSA